MPIQKKFIKIGRSRAVIIPAGWIKDLKEKYGRDITSVNLEIDGVITISPVINVPCYICEKSVSLFDAKSGEDGKPAHENCILEERLKVRN